MVSGHARVEGQGTGTLGGTGGAGGLRAPTGLLIATAAEVGAAGVEPAVLIVGTVVLGTTLVTRVAGGAVVAGAVVAGAVVGGAVVGGAVVAGAVVGVKDAAVDVGTLVEARSLEELLVARALGDGPLLVDGDVPPEPLPSASSSTPTATAASTTSAAATSAAKASLESPLRRRAPDAAFGATARDVGVFATGTAGIATVDVRRSSAVGSTGPAVVGVSVGRSRKAGGRTPRR